MLDELVAEDMVNHAAGPQGREGLRQVLRTIDHDLGPVAVEQHHLFGEGPLVAQHLTLYGTHRASTVPLLAGRDATGRPAAWTFIHIWRVVEGTIVEHWACRDDGGLLEQLGADRSSATGACQRPARRCEGELERPAHAADVEVVQRLVLQERQRVREVGVVVRPVEHDERAVEDALVALLTPGGLVHLDVTHRDVPGADQVVQRHAGTVDLRRCRAARAGRSGPAASAGQHAAPTRADRKPVGGFEHPGASSGGTR